MNIAIHVSNHPIAKAIYQFLVTNGYDPVVVSGRSPTNGFTPHVLLVDSTTLRHEVLARYPGARVLLMDTVAWKRRSYAPCSTVPAPSPGKGRPTLSPTERRRSSSAPAKG